MDLLSHLSSASLRLCVSVANIFFSSLANTRERLPQIELALLFVLTQGERLTQDFMEDDRASDIAFGQPSE